MGKAGHICMATQLNDLAHSLYLLAEKLEWRFEFIQLTFKLWCRFSAGREWGWTLKQSSALGAFLVGLIYPVPEGPVC